MLHRIPCTVRSCHGLSFSEPRSRCGYGRLPEWPKGAVCKTVGSAYVGSNPTPATTSQNGPLAANSRAGGGFLLCPVVCHLVALWTVMLRCPRTYSGRPSVRFGRSVWAATTVGVHSYDGRCAQLRRSVWTVGVSTDGHGRAALAACPGLTRAAESSVHPCVRPRG